MYSKNNCHGNLREISWKKTYYKVLYIKGVTKILTVYGESRVSPTQGSSIARDVFRTLLNIHDEGFCKNSETKTIFVKKFYERCFV